MTIDSTINEMYINIIDRLNKEKFNFFLNANSSHVEHVYMSMNNLRKTAKYYENTPASIGDFKKSIKKTLRIINLILLNKYLNANVVEPLTEMKEQLESIEVMMELD